MSKPRICKTCKWLRHRVEPCCSCLRWGKGKTDHYISAEETLGEYLKRKEREEMEKEKNIENLSTDELIKTFELCINADECMQCPFKWEEDCVDKLSAEALNRLKQLQQELIDERDRIPQSAMPTAPFNKGANEDAEVADTSSAPAGHLEVNCPAGAREATLGCPLEGKANGNDDTVRRCAEYVAEKHLQMDEEPPKKHKTKVICISGKAQHGKDTTAHFIKEYLEEHGKSVLIMHYSDLLKFIVRTYFGWNGEKDKDGRALLQYVGTDVIRRQSPDYWTDFAVGLIRMFPDEWDYVILADCRFPNEVECFKNTEFDTFHLRVIRAPFVSPLTPEQQLHPSETALDGVKADDYLLNTGTLEEYQTKVYRMLAYRDAFNREG